MYGETCTLRAYCIYLSTFIRNETSACTFTFLYRRGARGMFYVFDGFWLADRLPYICSREESKIRELILCNWKKREDEVEEHSSTQSVSILFRSHWSDDINGIQSKELAKERPGIGPSANCEKPSRPLLVILSSSHCLAAEFKRPRREHKEVPRSLPCFICEIFHAKWYPSTSETLHNKI